MLNRLSLGHNRLTGTIPVEVGSFMGEEIVQQQLFLRSGLFLNDNMLTGDIPNTLYSLTKLEHLAISGNGVSEVVEPLVHCRLAKTK